MIKRAYHINTVKDKFKIPLEVFKLEPPLAHKNIKDEIYYLTGAFYAQVPFTAVAFYKSDENGEILDENPIIREDGYDTYAEVLALIGYTLI